MMHSSSDEKVGAMDEEGEARWMTTTFPAVSVAMAVRLRNLTRDALVHVATGAVLGAVEAAFQPAPREEVAAGGGQAIVAASNVSRFALNGTSGVTIWRLGSTHYHLSVLWSAPRNFYTHANTLAAAITPGVPVQYTEGEFKGLFDRIYYAKEEDMGQSFFQRIVCNYGETAKEGSYSNNRYQVNLRLGESHKSLNSVVISDTYASAQQLGGGSGYVTFRKAKVKLLAHSRKGAYSRRNTDSSILTQEKNHVALMFEWSHPERSKGESEDDVIVCELVGEPGTKKDINLTDASRPSCSGTTKSRLRRERKSLGLRCFAVGDVYLNEEDLVYLASRRVAVRTELGLDDRCIRWLADLAELLNLPDQDLIPEAAASLVREDPLRVPTPSLGLYRGSGADSSDAGGTQEGLLLALSTSPAKIVAAEKIRSKECSQL